LGKKGLTYVLLVILWSVSITSCSMIGSLGERKPYTVSEMQNEWIEVDESVPQDSSWLAYLAPYRDSLDSYYGEIIARAAEDFELAKPESPLSNLAADMLRRRASREMQDHVDIGITNNGSLRNGLPAGAITRGQLFEMMPFADRLVLLKLKGDQVLNLADQIAGVGGQALSGMRMRIDGYKAKDVLVGSESVRINAFYWVATSSYLADGNGPFPALWKATDRIDFEITIREVFEEYLSSRQTVRPELDNRIRM
jgi:2',3'-cyclic-nucleotide 2'-phosphodiesterase (5'-nucleotidase family)